MTQQATQSARMNFNQPFATTRSEKLHFTNWPNWNCESLVWVADFASGLICSEKGTAEIHTICCRNQWIPPWILCSWHRHPSSLQVLLVPPGTSSYMDLGFTKAHLNLMPQELFIHFCRVAVRHPFSPRARLAGLEMLCVWIVSVSIHDARHPLAKFCMPIIPKSAEDCWGSFGFYTAPVHVSGGNSYGMKHQANGLAY